MQTIAQTLTNTTDQLGSTPSDTLFENIAQDLVAQGLSIQRKALPIEISDILHYHMSNMPEHKFKAASIGRHQQRQHNESVRNDQIVWINGESPAGVRWLQWCQDLQSYLNRRLFLGLHSFESHFAHYPSGHFYKRHFDAFKGQANRVVSIVTYLNPEWEESDGGELIIYKNAGDLSGCSIAPEYGTVSVFLSEEFEHEVLPTQRDRYSVAGWFRLKQAGIASIA